MRLRKLYFYFLFILFQSSVIFAQQTISLIEEPNVTKGRSNRVFSEKRVGVKTFLFKATTATKWDTIASSGNPNQYFIDVGGLISGVEYEYQVLFSGTSSNIVSSIQDDDPPIVTVPLQGNYRNQASFLIPFTAYDLLTKSVNRAYLFYRPRHNENTPWRYVSEMALDSSFAAIDMSPLEDSLIFNVPDSLGDGLYEFYVAARDTAWDPIHRPDEAFIGTEGNASIPINTTIALKQIFIDTHNPVSNITSQLNKIINSSAFTIGYSAKDSSTGHSGYLGSGIRKTSLYVNYKSDPDGPYISKDVLFETKYLTSPLLAVSGTFNFIADKDGYYEFYTITADTAQNIENNGLPKSITLPFVIVDTSPPKVDSLVVFDKLIGNHPAKPGWTKSREIGFKAFGVEDLQKDGFSSSLDSLSLAENLIFDKNLKKFIAQTGLNEGNYSLTDVAEKKTISLTTTDKASNSSIPVSSTITFDPLPPTIVNFDIPFSITTQRNIFVSVDLKDTFKLDSLFIWRDGVLISSILLTEDSTYSSDVPLTLLDEIGWHVFSAQVRDKAGNVSAFAKDSVKLSYSVVLSDLILSDLSSQTDPYFAAETGYSDSSVVLVNLTYQNYLLKLQFSEDPNFGTFIEITPPWNVINATNEDTTISTEYNFSAGDGPKNLYVRGFGPQLSDVSNVVDTGFIIDTTDPVLSEVLVYSVLSPGDTTFSYTKSRDVHVELLTADKDLAKIVFWESGLDSVLYDSFAQDTTYSFKSLDDGLILFNIRVRDNAGNWSSPSQTNVFLDRRLPIIESLAFNNRFSSSFQVEINVTVKDDTLFSQIGALEKIRFSENNAFPSNESQVFDLPEQVSFSGSFKIDLNQTFGEHTVYAQVKDRAGNWSAIQNAKIDVVDIVQPTSLTLKDLTPSNQTLNVAFSGWSNSDTVLVSLTHRGILTQILTARDAGFSTNFQLYDQWTTLNDSTVQFNYSFGNVEGLAELWVQLVGPNLTDSSDVISESITIDKTAPTLADFAAYQILNSGDTLFAFTNEENISIEFISPNESITNALVWETGADSQYYELNDLVISYNFATSVNELKSIYSSIRDSAGNWSLQEYSDTIILDTTTPTLSKLILSDRTTPGIEDSVLTDDLNIEVSLQATDILPGKLFKIIVAQNDAISLNREEFIFNTGQVQSINGMFSVSYQANKDYLFGNSIRCWVVVEDSASNKSVSLIDDIIVTEKLEISSKLFDLADPTDSLYSGSSKVGFFVKEVSGVYEEISFSENKADLSDWQKVSTGQPFSTEHEFSSSASFFIGKLFVSARNSAGQSIIDSALITIDKEVSTIQNVLIVATEPAGDQKYSNNKDVKIQLNVSDSGLLSQIHLSEDSTFTTFQTIDLLTSNVSSFQNDVDFELSENNGIKKVFVRAVDAAENNSALNFDDIIADYDPFFEITNHPNPFNPNSGPTKIIIKTLGSNGFEINIYDLFGNHVKKIEVPAGERYNQIIWDGKNGKGETVANGGYICVVETTSKTMTRKIAVIK